MQTSIDKNISINHPNMLIIHKIDDLTAQLELLKRQNKKVGFVPTMGALHDGHLSLVRLAKSENDVVAVSIFVNPTQFNNPDDLKNYPRTPEKDNVMLSENDVDIIFSPEVSEIYNSKNEATKELDLGKLGTVMEGAFRPGHFKGVVQIVSRLFDIVKPERAYFGEKDFQQLAIIRFMVDQLKYPVEIIACPTIREESGLAMSSRNQKLSKEGLSEATAIYRSLNYVRENYKKSSPDDIKRQAVAMIESSGKLKVEYFEIADEITLQQVQSWDKHEHARCFAAVFCEGVRLIDNISLF